MPASAIPAILPVQRISWPDEPQREAAVRNFRRVIELAVELGVPVINTEFSGRPERAEDSEAAFYRSMEELLPARRVGGSAAEHRPAPRRLRRGRARGVAGDARPRTRRSDRVRLRRVAHLPLRRPRRHAHPRAGRPAAAPSTPPTRFDHRRSHGLRYISNPPGNAARVHQHLTHRRRRRRLRANCSACCGRRATSTARTRSSCRTSSPRTNADEVSQFQLQKLRELIG